MYKAKLTILFLLAGSQIYQGPQEATPHEYFVHVCTISGIYKSSDGFKYKVVFYTPPSSVDQLNLT